MDSANAEPSVLTIDAQRELLGDLLIPEARPADVLPGVLPGDVRDVQFPALTRRHRHRVHPEVRSGQVRSGQVGSGHVI